MIRDFAKGFGAPFQGYRFLKQNRDLWFWALLPAAITLTIMVATLIYAASNLSELSRALLKSFPFYEEFFNWVAKMVWKGGFWKWMANLTLGSLKLFVNVVVILASSVFAYVLSLTITGFLWEVLAEKVMSRKEGVSTDLEFDGPIWKRFLFSLIRELIKALVLLIGPMILWALTFLPFLGPLVAVALLPLLTVGLLGFAIYDYPMSSREIPLSERWKNAKMRFGYLLGLGSVSYIPVVNLLLMPFFVISAALEYESSRKELRS